MARPRCDPFEAASIYAAIDRGETTERAAYLTYAATAARPYARSTFALLLKRGEPRQAPPDGSGPPTEAEAVLDRWRDRSPVKPRILSLSAGGGLRVKAGSLIAFDGPLTLIYSPASKPPLAIVLSAAGGFVSVEAIRFCARAGVAVVALDRAQGFLSLMSGAPKASAATLRMQVRAEPTPIARAIVAAKIVALRRAGALMRTEQFISALDRAASLDQIRNLEAQASRVAWPDAPTLQWEKGPIPSDWRSPWLMRTRLDAKGKRGARHPINAMLNAAFAVTAGRLAAYIAAAGLSPAVGFLHSDKVGRWSLAWDAIEPLRPMIEARTFRFVARERFTPDDFIRAPDGSLRLAPGLLSAVLDDCAPPSQPLAQCVRWLTRLIENGGLAAKGEPKQSGKRLGDGERVGAAIGGGGFERDDAALLRVGFGGERG
jgi:CRISPR-associated endonuclease Cas1